MHDTTEQVVTAIEYNAKGQRVRIDYGNGASTRYGYEPDTCRLATLRTARPTVSDTTASQIFADATIAQDLAFTYDPVGNITRTDDAALPTVHYGNQQITPSATYTYDAVYRLVQATGREHIGQTTRIAAPPGGSRRDVDFAGLSDMVAHPNDLAALRTYTETYSHDAVGNLTSTVHTAQNGSWTRSYTYSATSNLDPAVTGNRLTSTSIGGALARITATSTSTVTT